MSKTGCLCPVSSCDLTKAFSFPVYKQSASAFQRKLVSGRDATIFYGKRPKNRFHTWELLTAWSQQMQARVSSPNLLHWSVQSQSDNVNQKALAVRVLTCLTECYHKEVKDKRKVSYSAGKKIWFRSLQFRNDPGRQHNSFLSSALIWELLAWH